MGSEIEQSTRSKACLPSAYNGGLAQMTWASARSLGCLGWFQGTLKRSQWFPSQVHTRNSRSRVTQGVRRYLRANPPLPRSTAPPRKGCFTWRALSPVSRKQAFTFILGFAVGTGILLPCLQPEYSDVTTFMKTPLCEGEGIMVSLTTLSSQPTFDLLTKDERRVVCGIWGKRHVYTAQRCASGRWWTRFLVTYCRCVHSLG